MARKKAPIGFKYENVGGEYRRKLEDLVSTAKDHLRDYTGNNKQVVKMTALDESDFRRRANAWPKFHQLAKDGVAEYPQFEDLMIDIYFALYQYEPVLRPAEAIAPSHRLNLKILHQAMSLDLWDQARAQGRLVQGQSMIGLVFIAQAILDGLPDEAKAQAKKFKQSEADREAKRARLESLIEQLQQQGLGSLTQEELDALNQEGDPAEDGEIEALMNQLSGMLGEADEADEAANTAANGQLSTAATDAARRALRRGLSAGVGQQNVVSSALASWGEDIGEWDALPVEERMALADRMQRVPNLKDFVDEIGRMQQVMLDARQQPNAREAQEITDITTGSNLSDAIASERIFLAHPKLRTLFYLKMAQQQLLINQYQGKEAAGKGPMILLVDVSGSTMGAPERWGKGFVMAALAMCKKDERDAAVVFFDSQMHPNGTFFFPKGVAPQGIPTLAQKVQVCEFYTGGGTEFMGPLNFAINQIEITDGEWEHADIVMVTDGVCGIDPMWAQTFMARCNVKNVRVHGVMLDLGAHYLKSMEAFCHNAWAVSSFAGAKAAAPIFMNLAV